MACFNPHAIPESVFQISKLRLWAVKYLVEVTQWWTGSASTVLHSCLLLRLVFLTVYGTASLECNMN